MTILPTSIMATRRSKKYLRGGCSAAVLLVTFGCTGNSDNDSGEHGNDAGQAGSTTNDAGHAGHSVSTGGASGAGTAGSGVVEGGAPGIGGEAGSGHSGASSGPGGQAGNGVGGAPEAQGGAGGSMDAPCVAPEGPDGTSCPDGYEPLDGYLLDEENACLTSPTVLTCRLGGTGSWWCVVDTVEDIVYYVPAMTCSHTSRFRLGTEDECAGIPDDVCD